MLPYRYVENKTRILFPTTVSTFLKNGMQEPTNHELGIRTGEEGAENASHIAHLPHHPVVG